MMLYMEKSKVIEFCKFIEKYFDVDNCEQHYWKRKNEILGDLNE